MLYTQLAVCHGNKGNCYESKKTFYMFSTTELKEIS